MELKHFLNHDPGVKEECDSIMVHAITQHAEMLLRCMNLMGFCVEDGCVAY